MKAMEIVKRGIVIVMMAGVVISHGSGSIAGLSSMAAQKPDVCEDACPVLDANHPGLSMTDLTPEATEKEFGGEMRIAAKSSTETDEYYSETAEYVESTLDAQMIAYMNGTSGKKAEVLSYREGIQKMRSIGATEARGGALGGEKSWVIFTLDADKLYMGYKDLAYYCWDGIANRENLCTLSIYGSALATGDGNVTVFFPSTLEVNEHKKYIREYKSFMAYLEKKVDDAASMSDLEILIYYYDMLGQATKYSKEVAAGSYYYDITVHMPVSIVKRDDIVCQGYAVILNQLLRHSGIVCYNVFGSTKGGGHAWNTVKIGGKWYYSDLTWDDNDLENKDRSLINHEYILFSINTNGRSMDKFYQTRLSGIRSKSGSFYDYSLFENCGAKNGFHYANGRWYFALYGSVYTIDMNTGDTEQVNEIPYDSNRFVGALGNDLYYGGTDGIYRFDTVTGESEVKKEGSFKYGYVRKNKLLAQNTESESWNEITDPAGDNITPSDTDNGMGGDTGKDDTSHGGDDSGKGGETDMSDVEDGIAIPTLKLKKVKGKKLRVKINGASDGAEFSVSDSEDFSSTDTREFSTAKTKSTWFLSGLSAGKTYFVRIRGYELTDGRKVFSRWSGARKVSVK